MSGFLNLFLFFLIIHPHSLFHALSPNGLTRSRPPLQRPRGAPHPRDSAVRRTRGRRHAQVARQRRNGGARAGGRTAVRSTQHSASCDYRVSSLVDVRNTSVHGQNLHLFQEQCSHVISQPLIFPPAQCFPIASENRSPALPPTLSQTQGGQAALGRVVRCHQVRGSHGTNHSAENIFNRHVYSPKFQHFITVVVETIVFFVRFENTVAHIVSTTLVCFDTLTRIISLICLPPSGNRSRFDQCARRHRLVGVRARGGAGRAVAPHAAGAVRVAESVVCRARRVWARAAIAPTSAAKSVGVAWW